MLTVKQNIIALTQRIEADLTTLLSDYSALRYKDPGHIGEFRITGVGKYVWGELSPDGKRLRSKLLDDYSKFCSIIKCLIRLQPPKTKEGFEKHKEQAQGIIEQMGRTYYSSTGEALNEGRESLNSQVRVIDALFSTTESNLLVPDTNALIASHELATWEFGDFDQFELVLTPQVLAELDRLKIEHRNENVRSKAGSMIRQIKEFRRRGRLSDGVPLVTSRSTLRSVAVEPDMESSLPWLDEHNPDDRLLAAFLEIMRLNPNSSVILVTGDINLQNKAEFAELPYMEPPSLGKEESK